MKRTSWAAKLFNVSETETYSINLVHLFFLQLFLSLLTLYWFKIRFSNDSIIRLCTTKEFFLIESIKICDDLNNDRQIGIE